MSQDPSIRVRFDGPAALVAGVPYLLGFEPERSAVLVLLCGFRVVLTARVDLPDPLPGRRAERAWRRLSEPLAAPVRHAEPEAAVVVLYPPAGSRLDDPAIAAAAGALRRTLPLDGVTLLDVLVVSDGRWRSAECADPCCCPVTGTPVEPAHLDVRAAFAFAGRAPLPSRAAVAARVSPLPDDVRRRCRDQVEAVAVDAAALAARHGIDLWRESAFRVRRPPAGAGRSAGPPAASSPSSAVPSAAAPGADRRAGPGRSHGGRGCRCRRRDPGRPGPRRAAGVAGPHQRPVAPPARARGALRGHPSLPAGLGGAGRVHAAAVAHLCGDGALAHAALDRAVDDEPGYSLAALLRRGLESGLPPAEVAHALGAFSPASLLLGDAA